MTRTFHSDLSGAAWRRSSYSNQAGGDCVDVAERFDVLHVRDSKAPNGPALCFNSVSWGAFTGELKAGHHRI
ncbi:hypothetical protein RKD26_003598 [Streptomyces calvus]|uniref:DUF397 domain-containing protein n=1 Tax=Streptomyces calvus TaxID=67282 RepID=UPI003513A7D0